MNGPSEKFLSERIKALLVNYEQSYADRKFRLESCVLSKNSAIAVIENNGIVPDEQKKVSGLVEKNLTELGDIDEVKVIFTSQQRPSESTPSKVPDLKIGGHPKVEKFPLGQNQ